VGAQLAQAAGGRLRPAPGRAGRARDAAGQGRARARGRGAGRVRTQGRAHRRPGGRPGHAPLLAEAVRLRQKGQRLARAR